MNVLSQIAQGGQAPGWGVLESKAKANALLQSDMQTKEMAQGEDPGIKELATTVTALNAALKHKNPEAAAEVYKQYHPNATSFPDFTKMVFGEEVSIPWSDGSTLEGPGSVISSFLRAVDEDPSQAQDPEKLKRNYAWITKHGVSVKPPTDDGTKGDVKFDRDKQLENLKAQNRRDLEEFKVKNSKPTKSSKPYEADRAKLIDDTRGFYALKQRSLLTDDGYVKEGKETEYNELTKSLETDMHAIGKGELPSWYKTGEIPQVGEKKTHEPKTQAEYDAIPSGEIFLNTDGKKYRKP